MAKSIRGRRVVALMAMVFFGCQSGSVAMGPTEGSESATGDAGAAIPVSAPDAEEALLHWPADVVSPTDGQTRVFGNAKISATWHSGSNLRDTAFTVRDTTGGVVAGDMVVSGGEVEFVTSAPLPVGTNLSVELTGIITDGGGEHRRVDEAWSFETLGDGGDILRYWDINEIEVERAITRDDFGNGMGKGRFGSDGTFDSGLLWAVNDPSGSAARGKVLRVTHLANAYGNGNGLSAMSQIEGHHTELYFAYDLYVPPGHYWTLGGKMPGFLGGSDEALRTYSIGRWSTGGGDPPEGEDAFSARGGFHSANAYGVVAPNLMGLEFYAYYPRPALCSTSPYAADLYRHAKTLWWDGGDGRSPPRDRPVEEKPYQVPFDRWVRIEQHVKLNSAGGVSDGVLEAWVDGEKVFEDRAFHFVCHEGSAIHLLNLAMWYGGNSTDWSAPTEQSEYFDNFVVSTRPITH